MWLSIGDWKMRRGLDQMTLQESPFDHFQHAVRLSKRGDVKEHQHIIQDILFIQGVLHRISSPRQLQQVCYTLIIIINIHPRTAPVQSKQHYPTMDVHNQYSAKDSSAGEFAAQLHYIKVSVRISAFATIIRQCSPQVPLRCRVCKCKSYAPSLGLRAMGLVLWV